MARHPFNRDAAADLGGRLRTYRAQMEQDRGKLSDERIAREVYATTNVEISKERVRQFHAGAVDPTSVDPNHLLAMARYYDLRASDLGPIAETRLNTLRDLLEAQRRCTALLLSA